MIPGAFDLIGAFHQILLKSQRQALDQKGAVIAVHHTTSCRDLLAGSQMLGQEVKAETKLTRVKLTRKELRRAATRAFDKGHESAGAGGILPAKSFGQPQIQGDGVSRQGFLKEFRSWVFHRAFLKERCVLFILSSATWMMPILALRSVWKRWHFYVIKVVYNIPCILT